MCSKLILPVLIFLMILVIFSIAVPDSVGYFKNIGSVFWSCSPVSESMSLINRAMFDSSDSYMPQGRSQSNVYNAGSNYVPQEEIAGVKKSESMIVRGVDDPREIVTDEEYIPSIVYDEVSGSGNTYGQDPGYRYGPFHDLDPDFVSSRERMGACKGSFDGGRSRCSVFTSIDTESLGMKNDDILDGERCAAMGLFPCVKNTPRSALKLMYNDVMGLPNQRPSEEDCEFKSTNGYTYKDRCDM